MNEDLNLDAEAEPGHLRGSGYAPELRTHYLERMFAQEAPNLEEVECQNPACTQPPLAPGTLYRCEDCFGDELLCSACLHSRHQNNPFHGIRAWTPGPDAFFRPTSLYETGFQLHLGHRGSPCPSQTYAVVQGTLNIGHTNGIHRMQVVYCKCPQVAESHLQLVNHRIYPATDKRPETGYTFALLRHFQLFHLASKTSAWDYHQGLQRLTNAVDPTAVPVRRH